MAADIVEVQSGGGLSSVTGFFFHWSVEDNEKCRIGVDDSRVHHEHE